MCTYPRIRLLHLQTRLNDASQFVNNGVNLPNLKLELKLKEMTITYAGFIVFIFKSCRV